MPTTKALKDIVFRFIIEYSSLRDFYRPLGNNNNRSNFYMRIFERWFWLVLLKLEISYRVLWYLEGFWFLLEDFFEDYFFAWQNILKFHNSSFALRYFFWCKWQGHSVTLIPLFTFGNWNQDMIFILFFNLKNWMPNHSPCSIYARI